MSKLNNFSFVRGSKAADRLTPEWMDAFDAAMSQWLGLLIPTYNTCKNKGVSFFRISNIIDNWSKPEKFTENGLSYLIWEKEGEVSHMAFDANGSGWRLLDFGEFMKHEFPHLYDHISQEYKRKMTELSDFEAYHCYFSRYLNCREPYNFIADRVREYFKIRTNDSEVDFSLGATCYFALDDAGKNYGKHFSQYYWG